MKRRLRPRFEALTEEFSNPIVNEYAFAIAYNSLQIRAAKIIEPLLKNVVEPPVRKFKKDRYARGFLCVDITDDQLSWIVGGEDEE